MHFYETLISRRQVFLMRVGMAAIVALLILNFVNELFNDGRSIQALFSVASTIVRSFG